MKRIAVLALTKNGFDLAEEIKNEFVNIELITINKNKRRSWLNLGDKLKEVIDEIFDKYDALVFIMATGIVVRMVADHIKKKSVDPAVIVIDEKNNYTISLLSGHLGGANDLTRELSGFLGNIPVITTATDVNNRKALDVLSSDYGLAIEPIELIKVFNTKILNSEIIESFIDDGLILESNDLLNPKGMSALSVGDKEKAIITNKVIDDTENIYLRPRNLVLGVGCRKDFSAEKFEERVLNALAESRLSLASVSEIRSVDLKAEEKAILDFSEKYDIPFVTYTSDELNRVFKEYPDLEKSEFVFKNIGTYGVAESSILVDGKEKVQIILNKQKLQGMTLAIGEFVEFEIKNKKTNWLIKKEG